MEVENTLIFFLIYEDRDTILQFSEYDTVEILKIGIHNVFGIPPHNQIIYGWKNTPDGDNTILQCCADEDITYLTVIKGNNLGEVNMADSINCNLTEELEVEATISFINKLNNNGILSMTLHSCTLENAINNTCLAPLEKKKMLLLYLHNQEDTFSSIFFENLSNSNVASVLQRSFFILGWDVSNAKYHSALINALNKRAELSNLTDMIKHQTAAAIVITGINDSVTVSSIMRGNVTNKDFLENLVQMENFYTDENNQEKILEQLQENVNSTNDFGSVQYQKLMADMLGDRDYDSFEFDQHDHLKNKIAYALMGPPKIEKGYDEKELKVVDHLYKVILNNSNEIAKYKDRLEMSFIYNCVEPLPSEKCRRSKKYEDYNPNTDLSPFPIFALRKCRGSANPCRVFIDHNGRTYATWQEYITRNKLHESEMVLPLNGRYDVDSNGEVLLERHLSPACSVNAKLLQGADIVNVAGGLISGGLLATASLSSIAFAPAILVTAGATCIGMGIYSMGRSAYTLYDRNKHKESLSFSNSEARGAYLNIVAGSLGFVGAGASMAVTQLAANGVNIGKGAGAVVNTIGFVNIGASGVSLINSGYDVFDQWVNENQAPSLLTIVQLSSSVLFFGNAVYNFKMCSTIVEETQSRTLQDYQESLRSNRHRKTFTKLLKETIRQNNGNEVRGRAEVISAIRNIQNKDEVFAVLTRSNKDMTKRGIKFTAADGEIRLNGIQIDMNEFMSMNKKNAKTFLVNLSRAEPTPVETTSMRRVITTTLKNIDVDMETFVNYTVRLLQNFNSDIKTKILNALASVMAKFTFEITETLDEIFPNHQKFFSLVDMVVGFFGKASDNLEVQYQMWLKTGNEEYYMPLFDYVNVEKVNRAVKFFETSVNMYYKATHFTEEGARLLLNYFYNWLTKQVFEYQEKIECNDRRVRHSAASPSKKIDCKVCGGYYFEQVKV